VAIDFGSQTLVKDVISGLFYLMDDAFRVGEYIQSGSYMGTVESFSLRSVRLRHHRGPIFTVAFGEPGAVQNMSRDWAIDKFLLRLSFDADTAKAKKLVKEIEADLLKDPELGPLIIEPLKLKGVEQIGDFGIEVSFTFTAVPGNQSMIRRSALAMIAKPFFPTALALPSPPCRSAVTTGRTSPPPRSPWPGHLCKPNNLSRCRNPCPRTDADVRRGDLLKCASSRKDGRSRKQIQPWPRTISDA
jgi:hypothetical protein